MRKLVSAIIWSAFGILLCLTAFYLPLVPIWSLGHESFLIGLALIAGTFAFKVILRKMGQWRKRRFLKVLASIFFALGLGALYLSRSLNSFYGPVNIQDIQTPTLFKSCKQLERHFECGDIRGLARITLSISCLDISYLYKDLPKPPPGYIDLGQACYGG